MKLTRKRLESLIREELQSEIKFSDEMMKKNKKMEPSPVDLQYGDLVSAVQDVLYRDPPEGEQPMDVDGGGVVKNPNLLAGKIATKIFNMLNPNFEE